MGDRRQLLNDSEESLRLALDGRQSQMWTALPGFIHDVDFTKMVVSVQPTIQGTIELPDGTIQTVNLPLLINVPLCFPSAGGFTITLPVTSGDEVLVVFSSRCIDSWWQSGGIGVPMEQRMHDLSDGFAILGPKSVPNVIPSISSTNLQIRNNAGTSYIEIAANGAIKIVAPIGLTVQGNMHVTGSIVADNNISTTAVSLNTHIHSGVTTGAGNTGGPV